MTVQLYNIHLTNGEVLQVGEDYDLHGAQTIVNRFYKAGDNDILELCMFLVSTFCLLLPLMC